MLFAKPPLALRRTLSLRTQLLAIQTALESDHTLLKQQAPSTPSTPAPEKPNNKHSGWLVPQLLLSGKLQNGRKNQPEAL